MQKYLRSDLNIHTKGRTAWSKAMKLKSWFTELSLAAGREIVGDKRWFRGLK